MRTRFLGLFLASLAGACLAPPQALAYEDAFTLELEAGYALAVGDIPTNGMAASVLGTYGINDAFTLRAGLTDSFHPRDANLVHGSVDLIYMIDVLTVVPYVGAGIDAGWIRSDGAAAATLGGHLALGVDYLWTRTFFMGLEIRPTFFLREASLVDTPMMLKFGFVFPN